MIWRHEKWRLTGFMINRKNSFLTPEVGVSVTNININTNTGKEDITFPNINNKKE